MKRRRQLPLLCLAMAMATATLAQAEPQPRLRPPQNIDCPRDQLTLYRGEVIAYTRAVGRTTLRIRTEWQTVERMVITHPGTDDPAPWFRIDGNAFTEADWARIESSKGRLRTGVRAAAWACADARNPTVQWTVPSAGSGTR
jgi:hypothetical protein